MTDNSTSPVRTRGSFRVWANLSLRYKLILLFLTMAMLSVGTLIFLNVRSTSAALTAQANDNMTTLAVLEARNFATILTRRVNAMQAFGQEERIQEGVAAQNAAYSGGTEAILSELIKLDEQWVAAGDDDQLVQERVNSELAFELGEIKTIVPDFAEVFVTDRYGGLVATSDRTSDYYQADEGWWQTAYNDGQGAVYIGTPELDESTGVIGVNMAVPVYGQGNEIVGILRTTLDATALVDRLANVKLGETGESGLLIGEELLAAHEVHEGYGADVTIALAQETTLDGYVEASLEGTPSLIGYAAVSSPTGEQFISDLGWKVIIHQDREEALAAVAQQIRAAGLLALVIAVVAAVSAVVIGQMLANPIANLTNAVTQFTSGDMAARAESKSSDEVGTLATSFNTMAEQVGGLLTTVQVRSAELEERTRELEASQRVTFAASERTSPDELLGLVVDLVRDQFDLYHAQVYLVDEEKQAAVLRQSTGYAGSQLLQKGHQIPLDAAALVTRAIHSGEPVLVADVNQAEDWLPNPLLPETQSELVVPLKAGGRIIGVLDAQDITPGRFTESTVALFQTMADQIAFLFENNELLERVTEQSETLTVFTTQLRTAAEIARQAGGVLDPEQLLQQVVDLMQSRFGLYHAHIYVLDEATDQLNVRAGSGEVGRVLIEEGHAIPLDREKSLVARAARDQEPVLVADTTLESDFMPNPLLPQTRSELSVPLVAGGRVLGVLDMQDDQAERFAESDVDTFTTLAGQIAVALQNAGLFEQVEENAQAAQVRFEVSQTLAGAQTEEEVLDALIQQMNIFPRTRPMIFTVAPEAEELTLIVRRQMTLDSGLSPLEDGMHLAVSQIPLLQDSAEGKSFIAANLLADDVTPAIREIARMTGARSQLTLPFMVGGEYLGVISVASREVGFFDEHKLNLYQTLAEQGATALQAARLRDKARESEERFRSIVEYSQAGILILDDAYHMIYVNDELCQIVGYPQEELIGVDFRGLLDEESLQLVADHYVRRQRGEEVPSRYEFAIIRKDGEKRQCEISSTTFKDSAGNVRTVGQLMDITERRWAEMELRAERDFSTTLIQASPAFLVTISGDGKTLMMNDSMLQALRYTLEEIEGTDYISTFVPKRDRETLGEVFAHLTELREPTLNENYILTKDGRELLIEWHGRPILKPDGEFDYFFGLGMDITERKQAEAERERFTTQLRTAADLAERVNAILDPDELLAEVVTQLQSSFDLYHVHTYILDQAAGKLVMRAGSGEAGQTMLEQGHSIPLDREKSLVARAARSREIVSVADTSTAPDFMPNPLLPDTKSEVAVPLVAGDKVLGVFDVQDNQPGRFTQADLDVFSTLAGQIATALQNASLFEDVQKAVEHVREADQRKSEFLADMSHELRTPLNSIIGYTELMLMGVSEIDPETLEDVQAIYDNGKHLLRIINDILDLAKIEAGQMELEMEEVHIPALLDEVKTSNAGLLINKPVEILIEAEQDAPIVEADRVRLSQILNNLIGNAIKFTEEGNITLRAFGDTDDGGWVCLEVQDTGAGMSEEDLEEIFGRFKQGSSLTRRAEGTGLGLDITRHLVELHGGTIDVHSEPGKGSTFIVRLPVEHRE